PPFRKGGMKQPQSNRTPPMSVSAWIPRPTKIPQALENAYNQLIEDEEYQSTYNILNFRSRKSPARIDCNISLSGIYATSSIGTLNIEIDSNPVLNGIYATGYVGDLGVQLDCNITLTGIYATTYVGDLTNIQASSSISLTGLYATAQLGTISSQLDVFPSITGV